MEGLFPSTASPAIMLAILGGLRRELTNRREPQESGKANPPLGRSRMGVDMLYGNRARRGGLMELVTAQRWHPALVLAAFVLDLAAGHLPPARASVAARMAQARAWGLPTARVPECFGVNIHFTRSRPGEMRMIAAAGFRWVRMDFVWDATEKTRGHYDFAAYDGLLAALRRHHMRALWILDYGNPLYQHGHPPTTPAARRAFCRWVAAALRHFRGHGIMWEMWNEPDGTFGAPPNARAGAYSKLAVAVGNTFRAVAPRELYVGPALSGGMSLVFLRRCFQAGVLKYFDAVTVHPYTNPDTVGAIYRRIRALMARYAPQGRKIPLISSEWGWTTVGQGRSAARQARGLARSFLINLSQGIPLSIWYDWHNDGPDPNNSGLHFGLVRFRYHPGRKNVYTPKPAYFAARTLMRKLNGCRFVKRLKVGGADVYALLFAGPNGNRIAVWKAGGHSPRTLLLPLQPGRYRLTNETGTRTRTLVVPPGDRRLPLSVSQYPEYLQW